MARWRDIKHTQQGSNNQEESSSFSNEHMCASIPSRIKAFIVDMFMIMMPLAYITTYFFMDGKEDFQQSHEARWAISIIYGLIVIAFWIIKGQTPGLKAYDLKIVDAQSKENLSLFKALLRYLAFLFSAVSILLAFIPFFRKDKKTLQDLVANSVVISTK
jgi:uncharacterized RDD family membrane protein YckC